MYSDSGSHARGKPFVLPGVPKESLGQKPQTMILERPVCPTGPGAGTPKKLDWQNAVLILSLGPPMERRRPSPFFLPRNPIDTFIFDGRLLYTFRYAIQTGWRA